VKGFCILLRLDMLNKISPVYNMICYNIAFYKLYIFYHLFTEMMIRFVTLMHC